MVSAFALLIQHLSRSQPASIQGEQYGVSSPRRFSLKELVQVVEKIAGLKIKANWGAHSYRPREVMIPWTKSNPIEGWEPQFDIEDGLRKMMECMDDG